MFKLFNNSGRKKAFGTWKNEELIITEKTY